MARKSLLPEDFGARVRAARGYANMSRPKFAEALGEADAGDGTIKGWENQGKKPRPLAEGELIRRLAQVSKLPEVFFTESDLQALFERAGRPSAIENELAEIRKELSGQREQLDLLTAIQESLELQGETLVRMENGAAGAIRAIDGLIALTGPPDAESSESVDQEDLPPEAPAADG